jgi:hypothetical protein
MDYCGYCIGTHVSFSYMILIFLEYITGVIAESLGTKNSNKKNKNKNISNWIMNRKRKINKHNRCN